MSDTCDLVAAAALRTPGASAAQIAAFLVNILNQMFISFVAVYMSWLCTRLKFEKTAFHAWFCTIGFAFLMAEGVMTFYQGNILTHPFSNESKTTLHWVLQAVGGSFGIIGSVQKILGKKEHFTTIHGKVGLAATVICGVNMLAGVIALYSTELQHYYSPMFNTTLHSFLGVTTFVLGMITQFYGYETGFFKRNGEKNSKSLFKFLTVATVVLTVIGPLKNILNTLLS